MLGLKEDLFLPSASENILIVGIDIAIVAAVYLTYGWSFVDTFGLVMLIEAATLMLIGGAMEFSTSASGRAFVSFVTRRRNLPSTEDYRRFATRAETFTFVGVLLFVEALGLAVLAD